MEPMVTISLAEYQRLKDVEKQSQVEIKGDPTIPYRKALFGLASYAGSNVRANLDEMQRALDRLGLVLFLAPERMDAAYGTSEQYKLLSVHDKQQ